MLHWILFIADGQLTNAIRNHYRKNRIQGSVSAYDEDVMGKVPTKRWGEHSTPEQQAIAKEGIETLSSMDVGRWSKKLEREYKTNAKVIGQTLHRMSHILEGGGRSHGGRTGHYIDRITAEGNR